MKKPTAEYVAKCLSASEGKDVYYRADPAVKAVFDACEGNRDDGYVIAKVTILNALYATRIMNIYPVVDHILKLSIDDRLRAGDETLVGDVAWGEAREEEADAVVVRVEVLSLARAGPVSDLR